MSDGKSLQTAVLGGGCFWCLEAVFQLVKGVERVVNGYAGGHSANPTYEDVLSHTTGHAEVVQITFNPAVMSYGQLLEIFWHIHDPTTLNRQGNDVGEQYRSIILYADDTQRRQAEKSLNKVALSIWDEPIVTQIQQLQRFYPAEAYHQNYFNNNPSKAYCQAVINPKLQKFQEKFENLLKN